MNKKYPDSIRKDFGIVYNDVLLYSVPHSESFRYNINKGCNYCVTHFNNHCVLSLLDDGKLEGYHTDTDYTCSMSHLEKFE